jgi:hypothetical protein
MRGLNLNKPSRLTSNRYFSMIGDDLITPTSSADLQESYFNARVQAEKTNPELKKKVKALLQDAGSGVYFSPSFKSNLALQDLIRMTAQSADNKAGTGKAWDKLQQAKENRSNAISDLKKLKPYNKDLTNINAIDKAIADASYPSDLGNDRVKSYVNSAINNINEWVAYQTVADAYAKEWLRRTELKSKVEKAILKEDEKELKQLVSVVNITELEDKIKEALTEIKKAKADAANRTEEERKAKALADAEAKALADAIKKAEAELAAATSPEAKAAAQAKLNDLKNSGSNSNGASSGLPKMAIYGGIALVVAIGAYFMFKKKA